LVAAEALEQRKPDDPCYCRGNDGLITGEVPQSAKAFSHVTRELICDTLSLKSPISDCIAETFFELALEIGSFASQRIDVHLLLHSRPEFTRTLSNGRRCQDGVSLDTPDGETAFLCCLKCVTSRSSSRFAVEEHTSQAGCSQMGSLNVKAEFMKQSIASAVFDSQSEAERAVTELRSAGVRDSDISIVAQHDGKNTSTDGAGEKTAKEHSELEQARCSALPHLPFQALGRWLQQAQSQKAQSEVLP
jgi:hypothetical protein